MRRGTIFLLLFIVVVAGVIGVSQFLRNQPALKITVAVDPLAADWVRAAVTRYNATEPLVNGTQRVEAEVSQVVNDMDVWQGRSGWTTQNHPLAWIASSSVSVDYAQGGNVPVEVVTSSVGRTLLVWGGYSSRTNVITSDGTSALDWDAIAEAAATSSGSWSALGGESSWGFLKLAFPLPDSTMSGLAVLFSGAASFRDTTTLTNATRGNDFYNWLLPIIEAVPNFQTLGGDIAGAIARGPSTIEVAILPESQWLTQLDALTDAEAVVFAYPDYQFVFDFPVTGWDDAQTTDVERAAVKSFADWLATTGEQGHTSDFGLRPASTDPLATAPIFANAIPYGIMLTPTFEAIQAPPRTEAQGLIQWFSTNQRR